MTSDFPPQIFSDFGVLFKDTSLLTLALTHASKHKDLNNERLEFLGDRVIGLVLADMLYKRYPHEAEGKLALRHAALVRAEMLATLARGINLSSVICVSGHERAVGTGDIDNVLADAMEALLGALYLDAGLDASVRVILSLWDPYVTRMTLPPQDPKTALQEWAQARGLPLPVYTVASKSGPDHAPIFVMEVQVKGHASQKAEGPSRRIAEKLAAAALLKKLQNE